MAVIFGLLTGVWDDGGVWSCHVWITVLLVFEYSAGLARMYDKMRVTVFN